MLLYYILFYYPTEVITLLLTFSLLNFKLKTSYTLLFPLIHAIYLYFAFSTFDEPTIVVVISLFLIIFILKVVLNYQLLPVILVMTTAYSIYLPLESGIHTLNKILFNISYQQLFFSSQYTTLAVTLFTLILLVFYWLRKKYSYQLINADLRNIIQNKTTRLVIWVIIIVAMENFLLMFHLVLSHLDNSGLKVNNALFIAGLVSVILYYLILHLFKILNHEIKLTKTQAEIDNLSNLNYTLKTQQHDFKQHLQLLMSLIQMKKFDKTLEYIKSVTAELEEIRTNSSSALPALDGLLQYKKTMARRHGIELHSKITSKLDSLPLSESQVCRVIGNLISNAIEYLHDKNDLEKYIQLFMYDTGQRYIFNIANPVQAEEYLNKGVDKIMEPGQSSKGKGRGLGLAIAKQLINSAGGEIKPILNKNNYILSFKIILPKTKDSTISSTRQKAKAK